jgi:hypothetical protein
VIIRNQITIVSDERRLPLSLDKTILRPKNQINDRA